MTLYIYGETANPVLDAREVNENAKDTADVSCLRVDIPVVHYARFRNPSTTTWVPNQTVVG